MSSTLGGFAAPQDAADAIVDEILRRRINAEASRRETAQHFVEAVKTFETEVEERVLHVALAHLLGNGDAQAFVQESVHGRYLGGACMKPGTEEVVLCREGLALKLTSNGPRPLP
ncbi:hypothetical protein [Streptomyces alfalfae]|uniref:Uncharacterized protein n=1 Tax=Streptomyces alfalfae TaxID=1642299 RepID=A0A7T4PM23_9ACTN|nr:hypothetical protein [Streptomyces alfalfae]QQC92680.1 hypothetical protein I8755_33155 [Streptomyces alfalfae]